MSWIRHFLLHIISKSLYSIQYFLDPRAYPESYNQLIYLALVLTFVIDYRKLFIDYKACSLTPD